MPCGALIPELSTSVFCEFCEFGEFCGTFKRHTHLAAFIPEKNCLGIINEKRETEKSETEKKTSGDCHVLLLLSFFNSFFFFSFFVIFFL